jgi:hypothetical protein
VTWSWSFQATSTTGQTTHMTMRVYRSTGTPHQYTAIADGPKIQRTQSRVPVTLRHGRALTQAGWERPPHGTTGPLPVHPEGAVVRSRDRLPPISRYPAFLARIQP